MYHRYILEPYKGVASRYNCPRCDNKNVFTRYIDIETGQYISVQVGRCNRESKCGYHYKPKQYFEDHHLPENIYRTIKSHQVTSMGFKKKAISFIDPAVYKASLKGYDDNCLVSYLVRLFGYNKTDELTHKYSIGTSKYWNGATVFWQIDKFGKIRTGKIMLYNPNNGKRVKEPFNHITWVHRALKIDNFELQQCLFGEHLLNEHSKPVAIVESEKTAIIASVYFPEFIWLATGSISNLTIEKCRILKGRYVVLFPDIKGYQKWHHKASELSAITKIVTSDFLEQKATFEEQNQGLDLADYLVRFNYQDFSLPKPVEQINPLTTELKIKEKNHSIPLENFSNL